MAEQIILLKEANLSAPESIVRQLFDPWLGL